MSIYRDWAQSNPDAASRRLLELEEENFALKADNQKLRDLLVGWYDWEAQEYRDRMNDRDPKEIN